MPNLELPINAARQAHPSGPSVAPDGLGRGIVAAATNRSERFGELPLG